MIGIKDKMRIYWYEFVNFWIYLSILDLCTKRLIRNIKVWIKFSNLVYLQKKVKNKKKQIEIWASFKDRESIRIHWWIIRNFFLNKFR